VPDTGAIDDQAALETSGRLWRPWAAEATTRYDRAKLTAVTRAHPPDRRACAQARSVAPVVITSSTTTAAEGALPAGHTRGGEASRSARGRPTCRLPRARLRHGSNGSPARAARPAAIASAASNPRRRRRIPAAGTGTTVPSTSPSGARAAIIEAACVARERRARNFRATTRSLAGPSYGAADQAASTPGIRVGHGLSESSAAAHPRQTRSRGRHSRSHNEHRGGTTSPTSSSSIAGHRRGRSVTDAAHRAEDLAAQETRGVATIRA
jgi:hypothetical protein